ncbi:tautomerase family protein [Oxalobacteraceae bacterium A2-2]
MPLSRISLRKGHTADYLQALSDNLHRALVEAFDVPRDDRFQLIHQHEPNELVYDRHYLGGPRSEDFVVITVTAGRPRSTEMKAAFFRRTAELLAESPGIRPQDVMIVINTTQGDEWSFSDGVATVPRPEQRP